MANKAQVEAHLETARAMVKSYFEVEGLFLGETLSH